MRTLISSTIALLSTASLTKADEYTSWEVYTTPIAIPPVVDMTKGGSIHLTMGKTRHSWGGGLDKTGDVYGIQVNGDGPFTYPGPTIRAKINNPIDVTWQNKIGAPHILDKYIEQTLVDHASFCYPDCGVPVVIHGHGMKVPATYDGTPFKFIAEHEQTTYHYGNAQLGGTMVYHDHSPGLTRLNVWAGLVGVYIIEEDHHKDLGVLPDCDIPLIIQDKLIDEDGSLLYATNACKLETTNWASESYGSVNLVNGKVAPYLEVPREQCRLRFVNSANARHYQLKIPFGEHCHIVSKDAVLLNKPVLVNDEDTLLYALDRVDMICDFSKVPLGSIYNITNGEFDADVPLTEHVMQIRVSKEGNNNYKPVASKLNEILSLKQIWKKSGGITKNITLQETLDADDCSVGLSLAENNVVKSFMQGTYISCQKGMVEKWNFINPTADFHPFHWHLIQAQCGSDDESPRENELADVQVIPNAEGDKDKITQVCYVACTPEAYIMESTHSKSNPKSFGFSTREPYLIHCHILEHEENDMMTWFRIMDSPNIIKPQPGASSSVTHLQEVPTSAASDKNLVFSIMALLGLNLISMFAL